LSVTQLFHYDIYSKTEFSRNYTNAEHHTKKKKERTKNKERHASYASAYKETK